MDLRALPREDLLDPAVIAAELPDEDRRFFLAEYRQHLRAAEDPQRWHELWRFLRRWRYLATAMQDPEYRRPEPGDSGGGMPFDTYLRLLLLSAMRELEAECYSVPGAMTVGQAAEVRRLRKEQIMWLWEQAGTD